MSTSGSVDFTVTRNEIIRDALLDCNGIEENESLGTTQLSDAARRLNMFVKRINARKPIWGKIDYTIPLYDGKQSYTIGLGGNKNVNRPRRLDKEGRRVATGSTNENPIEIVSRTEYMGQPNKTTTGEVTMFYYDGQLTLGVLYVWPTSQTSSTSLSDGSTDNWTVSGTATEYYYTGADITAEPSYVFINNSGTMVEMTKGTAGSLTQYEYAWGDNDALGADTLYVWSATDPDTTSGSVKVLTASNPSKIIVTANRPLEDFDGAADNPDFPQEAYEMLVDNLAYILSFQYSTPQRRMELKAKAGQSTNAYLADDIEEANMKVQPRRRR
jgi:hypothetical protein